MGSIKGRNGIDQTEADNIKKKWKNSQKNYTNIHIHELDNHDGVITQLEPDILECDVKWPLGSITNNRASGHDGIPVEPFQILKKKNDAVKGLHLYARKFGKFGSGHRTGKGQF